MLTPPTQLCTPPATRLTWIGGVGVAGGLLWIVAITVGPMSGPDGSIPRSAFICLLGLALGTSIAALHLGLTHRTERASSHNHRVIIVALAELAAQNEQLSARIDQLARIVEGLDKDDLYRSVAEQLLDDHVVTPLHPRRPNHHG